MGILKKSTFEVVAESGIHARPATGLVHKASSFSSEIFIEYNERKANLKSILGVMSLGIAQGESFSIYVEGEDEEEAFAGLVSYMQSEGLISS